MHMDFSFREKEIIQHYISLIEQIKHLEVQQPNSEDLLEQIISAPKNEKYPLKRDLRKEMTAIAIVYLNGVCKDEYERF